MRTFKIKSYVVRIIDIEVIETDSSSSDLLSVYVSINDVPKLISYTLLDNSIKEDKGDNNDFKELISYDEYIFKVITSVIYEELVKKLDEI